MTPDTSRAQPEIESAEAKKTSRDWLDEIMTEGDGDPWPSLIERYFAQIEQRARAGALEEGIQALKVLADEEPMFWKAEGITDGIRAIRALIAQHADPEQGGDHDGDRER